jgi:hypothetical protein
MTLFLIAGMPVFFIALTHVFFSDSFYGRELLAPLGIGALWFFPFCLVYALFSDLVPVAYGGKEFYFSRTGLDLAFPFLFCLLTGLFVCRKRHSDQKGFFLHLAAFFTGFFMLFAQYVRITFPGWYAEYIYFFLPLLWMAMTVFAAFLMPLVFSIPGALRFVFLLALAALPFVMGAVPCLYAMNYRIFAWILTAVFFVSPLVLVWRIPLSHNG